MAASLHVGVVAWLLLLAYTIQNDRLPTRAYHDERYHLHNLDLFRQYGVSNAFFAAYDATPGPLYTFVQAALWPLTRGHLAAIRCTNVVFLLILVLLTTRLVRATQGASWPAVGWLYLFVPTTWLVGGLVLTELPTMICATLFVHFWGRSFVFFEEKKDPHRVWLYASAAGLCLGLSVLGRQSFLAVALALVVWGVLDVLPLGPSWRGFLGLKNGHFFKKMLLVQGIAAVLYVPLFVEWGGVIPPRFLAVAHNPIDWFRPALVLGYATLMVAVVAPTWLRAAVPTRRAALVWGGGCLLAVGGYVAFGTFAYLPNKALLGHLPVAWADGVGRAFSAACWVAAAYFLVCVYANWRTSRWRFTDGFLYTCFLGTALACIFISVFGSRYVYQALPFLMPILGRFWFENAALTLLRVSAAALGWWSLHLTL
jgi:hypothetical protein